MSILKNIKTVYPIGPKKIQERSFYKVCSSFIISSIAFVGLAVGSANANDINIENNEINSQLTTKISLLEENSIKDNQKNLEDVFINKILKDNLELIKSNLDAKNELIKDLNLSEINDLQISSLEKNININENLNNEKLDTKSINNSINLTNETNIKQNNIHVHDHEPKTKEDAKIIDQNNQNNFVYIDDAIKDFPIVELGSLDSFIGESKEQFLLRVGSVLHNFTVSSGHEGCGPIMSKEENGQTTYRVRLITNRSQIACLRVMHDEFGFTYTGETIHSHPYIIESKDKSKIKIRANRADQRLVGFTCGRPITIEDASFSKGDLLNGSGYLVARGQLLYNNQVNGTNNIVTIGQINTNVTPSPLSTSTFNHSNNSYMAAWTSKDDLFLPVVSCRAEIADATLRPINQPVINEIIPNTLIADNTTRPTRSIKRDK